MYPEYTHTKDRHITANHVFVYLTEGCYMEYMCFNSLTTK